MSKKRFSISYDAPFILVYTVLCMTILILSTILLDKDSGTNLAPSIFTAPCAPFPAKNPLSYIRLFTHIFGNSDWAQFLGNFTFIILLGPLMEERYGYKVLALMFVITAFVTGVINACFIQNPAVGANGIVFMLIILSSTTAFEKKKIPATLILLLAIFLGKEFIGVNKNAAIAATTHILGGICGSAFGFLSVPKPKRTRKSPVKHDEKTVLKTATLKTKTTSKTLAV